MNVAPRGSLVSQLQAVCILAIVSPYLLLAKAGGHSTSFSLHSSRDGSWRVYYCGATTGSLCVNKRGGPRKVASFLHLGLYFLLGLVIRVCLSDCTLLLPDPGGQNKPNRMAGETNEKRNKMRKSPSRCLVWSFLWRLLFFVNWVVLFKKAVLVFQHCVFIMWKESSLFLLLLLLSPLFSLALDLFFYYSVFLHLSVTAIHIVCVIPKNLLGHPQRGFRIYFSFFVLICPWIVVCEGIRAHMKVFLHVTQPALLAGWWHNAALRDMV